MFGKKKTKSNETKPSKPLTEHKKKMIDLISLIQEKIAEARKSGKSNKEIVDIVVEELYIFLRPYNEQERLENCTRFINYYDKKIKGWIPAQAAVRAAKMYLNHMTSSYTKDYIAGLSALHPGSSSTFKAMSPEQRGEQFLSSILAISKLAISDKHNMAVSDQSVPRVNNPVTAPEVPIVELEEEVSGPESILKVEPNKILLM